MSKTPENASPKAPERKLDISALTRVIKLLFKFYPVMIPVVLVCIVFSAAVSSIPAIFQQRIIAAITKFVSGAEYAAGNYAAAWNSAKGEIIGYLIILGSLYVLSIILIVLYYFTAA